MDSFIEAIKSAHFYYARFISEIVIDKDFLIEYNKFNKLKSSQSQKEFFDLTGLSVSGTDAPNAYQFTILVPNFKLFKKEDIDIFKSASDFFENKLKDPVSIFGRIVFHYPTKNFYSEPSLPVILEEKKDNIGKVVLKGMRVAFPEYSEFNSVILDVQACSHCKTEDIFLDVQLNRVEKYNFEYLKNIIKKAMDFSKVFVKEKAPKDEQR